MRKSISLLLLGIMLATQTLTFAHEFTHLPGGDTELCEVCRIHGSSPAIIDLAQEKFDVLHCSIGPPQYRSCITGADGLTNFHARAPPRLL
jgi:hypothetical protein